MGRLYFFILQEFTGNFNTLKHKHLLNQNETSTKNKIIASWDPKSCLMIAVCFIL